MSSRILPEFELLVPQSVEEALGYLEQHGEKTAVMAGGTDLLVLMKSGYEPEFVLSLCEIEGLDYLDYGPSDGLRIGAMATLAHVAESDLAQEKYPALWKSARDNGTAQTRNTATVVGNVLRASPAGDCCCALLAYGATVVLEGPSGRRQVHMDDFFQGYRVTARRSDEFAREIRIPPLPSGATSAFSCMTRTNQDLAKINAAACLIMEGELCTDARVAMGAVGPTHVRLKETENLLKGATINEELLQGVAKTAGTEISPIDDVRSSEEYRRQVAGVLARRVIEEACRSV